MKNMKKMNKSQQAIVLADQKGYKINKDGSVNGLRVKTKKLRQDRNGYWYFKIRLNKDEMYIVYVHQFMAYKKFEDKIFEDDIEVRHLDNDKNNNCWSNIGIGTPSQNMNDRPEEERYKHAKKASLEAKIHEHRKIIDYYNLCRSYKDTMDKFDISSKGTLYFIINKSEASQGR